MITKQLAVAAAREAAGTEHPRFFDYLCRAPQRPAARPAASRPPAPPARREPPPQSEWYADPAKVFDNLYFLGTRSLNAWAITTSGGIVIIDPLYDYNVEAEIIEGLRTLGLDPADITHVLVSHGHGDHYGGAQQLQRRFGARVLLSAPDWDLMLANSGSQPKPTRDTEVTDGQQLSVGDTQLTFTLTPVTRPVRSRHWCRSVTAAGRTLRRCGAAPRCGTMRRSTPSTSTARKSSRRWPPTRARTSSYRTTRSSTGRTRRSTRSRAATPATRTRSSSAKRPLRACSR